MAIHELCTAGEGADDTASPGLGFAATGGLMNYSIEPKERDETAAVFCDKILKGAKPADLPVQRPTRFELVINLETANTLGLTVPQSLLARADEVIE
jgi:putative ABC transport system substrate-binding protein